MTESHITSSLYPVFVCAWTDYTGSLPTKTIYFNQYVSDGSEETIFRITNYYHQIYHLSEDTTLETKYPLVK